MNLPRYERYKDSGVPWLGEIPAHWGAKRLKYMVSCYGGGTPSKGNAEYWNGDIPWVSPKDMACQVIIDSEDHITEEAIQESATKIIEPGAVLVVVRSGILRHTIPVAINTVKVALNQDMKALVPKKMLRGEFLKYYIQGLNGSLLDVWSKMGCTVESIETEYMLNSVFPTVPLSEQAAIAAFLDRETARIDSLIEKKRRFIELLQEKRSALISHAVTRGLNPVAPLRDSGIEWLGQIPAHWEVKRLRFLTSQITVGIVVTPSKYYTDDGIPALRSLNVKPGHITSQDLVFISEESNVLLAKSKIYRGDLVSIRTGQPGTTAVVDDSYHGANCIDLIITRSSKAFDSQFMCFVLNSDRAAVQFSAGSDGALQQHFNIETAKNLLIPLPPMEEQLIITQYVDRETTRLDNLRTKVESAIDKLKEYRSALITGAVTGKIDVREAA